MAKMDPAPRPGLGAVAIGRNEGDRLKACLHSLVGQCERVVYVDSGSNDDSVSYARSLGVKVVELDSDIPFTAARARNAGVDALLQDGPLELVQFVDGDCEVVAGWLQAGADALIRDPALGLVTGWRAEINPELSVYNAMCQVEWHRPAGPITVSGGDMMVRMTAFQQVGGFNAGLIAGEDPEFSIRLGKAGWKLERLPLAMTLHDANMMRFRQWWQRNLRSGHAYVQVAQIHPGQFSREVARIWIYGLILPVMFFLGLLMLPPISLAVLALYGLSWHRTARGLRHEGLGRGMAFKQAALLTLSKIPNLFGALLYYRRRLRQEDMQLIEYK